MHLDSDSGSRVVRESASLDTLYADERSNRMRQVKSKNTEPEMRVRRAHALGFRYRLHVPGLPGRPDLVFRGRKKVIFVHGCFWHRHPECPRARMPKSPERREFWRQKFEENARRDARHQRELRAAGWHVLVIWGCETEDLEGLKRELLAFLD